MQKERKKGRKKKKERKKEVGPESALSRGLGTWVVDSEGLYATKRVL